MLSYLSRWAYSGPTPLFLINKNAPGIGGSRLAEVAQLLCAGRKGTLYTVAADNQQEKKQLDQIALNAAIHDGRIREVRLPATCNWIAHLAMPAVDAESGKLVEPDPPFEPIGILRKDYALFANLRPIQLRAAAAERSPLRPSAGCPCSGPRRRCGRGSSPLRVRAAVGRRSSA